MVFPRRAQYAKFMVFIQHDETLYLFIITHVPYNNDSRRILPLRNTYKWGLCSSGKSFTFAAEKVLSDEKDETIRGR